MTRPASTCEIYQWLEFSLNGLQAQSRVSPEQGNPSGRTVPLPSGQSHLEIKWIK
jgi:hypothetical protein